MFALAISLSLTLSLKRDIQNRTAVKLASQKLGHEQWHGVFHGDAFERSVLTLLESVQVLGEWPGTVALLVIALPFDDDDVDDDHIETISHGRSATPEPDQRYVKPNGDGAKGCFRYLY